MKGSRFTLVLLLAFGCATTTKVERPPDLALAYKQIEDAPTKSRGYLELARLYFKRGDLLRARQYLTLGERLPIPANEELAAFRLGLVISVRGGQHDEAILRSRRYLERREDLEVRTLLATLLEGIGRIEEAELERRHILATNPSDPHQVIELARFYHRLPGKSREEQAVTLYKRYLEKAPLGPEAPQAKAALRHFAVKANPNEGMN